MDNKAQNAMRFYLLATKLKYKLRTGWTKEYWNVSSNRIESVAEHVYGTLILAISLNYEYKLNLDMEKVLKMLTIHEIGEVIVGDITPYDNVTEKEKVEMERSAGLKVLGDLVNKEELNNLLIEFDERSTKEAKFAYLCDKMEAVIQAKVYQDNGYQHNLGDQEGNKVINNPDIKKIIDNGAKTVFDVWYECYKDKLTSEEAFKDILSYVKNNNTKI